METDKDQKVTARNIRGLRLIYRENNPGQINSQYLYYLHNAHGDVTQLLNQQGQVIKDYRYDTFGQEVTAMPQAFGGNQAAELWRQEVEKIDNPFRYCGEYLDEETGNYYLRVRYYDPSIQRFINEDSYAIAYGAAWKEHLYSYANNDPINRIDPSGHISLKIGSRGSEVKKLQKALGIKADGIFGPKTQTAVNKFKKSHGLGNTGQYAGVVGDYTWKALGLSAKGSNNSSGTSTTTSGGGNGSSKNGGGSTNKKGSGNTYNINLNVKYDSQLDDTIKAIQQSGCALTSASMVFNFYGANTTPDALYKGQGNSVSARWSQLDNIAGLNLKLTDSGSSNHISQEQVFSNTISALQSGAPVIVRIGYSKNGKSNTHFVVIDGVVGDGTQNSDFLVRDPGRNVSTYNSYTNYSLQDAINAINGRKGNSGAKVDRYIIYEQ